MPNDDKDWSKASKSDFAEQEQEFRDGVKYYGRREHVPIPARIKRLDIATLDKDKAKILDDLMHGYNVEANIAFLEEELDKT
jgi:hypothetical protein